MSTSRHRQLHPRTGASLIEVLTVVYILGVLVALLIPAVQSARESSRRASCQNNLRQLAVGGALHLEARRHFPTGGWGWRWQGDPDRGFGPQQPGGWAYGMLPYIEQTALRELGRGKTPVEKRAAGRTVAETPIELFACPSRRAAVAYPFVHEQDFVNIDRPLIVARSDYAANIGDFTPEIYGPGPATLAEGDHPKFPWPKDEHTGIVFRRSRIGEAHIRDGLGKTYLFGEGYLNRSEYSTGAGTNDDQGLYAGYDRDTLRTTSPQWPPQPDHPDWNSDHSFGSAHPDGFAVAMCDGSVRTIPYTIDAEVHRRLGHRHDGLSIDDAALPQ